MALGGGWDKFENFAHDATPTVLTAVGTGVGAVLGAPAGGIGAVPGAAIGASAGQIAGQALQSVWTSPEEAKAKRKSKEPGKIAKEYAKALEQFRPDDKALGTYTAELNKMLMDMRNDPYAKELEALYSGAKPSAAELLLRKGQEAAYRQQLSAIASARGGVNYAALARTTSNNIAMLNQKAMEDAAILRAQEQERLLNTMLDYRQKQNQAQMQAMGQMFGAAQAQQGQELQYAGLLQGATNMQYQASRDAMAYYQQQQAQSRQERMAALSAGANALAFAAAQPGSGATTATPSNRGPSLTPSATTAGTSPTFGGNSTRNYPEYTPVTNVTALEYGNQLG